MIKKSALIPVFAALTFTAIATAAAPPARANDEATVRAFYTELLSKAGEPGLKARAEKVLVKDWVTTPAARGGQGRAGFVKTLGGFAKIIPDLKWRVVEIIKAGNRYTVRGEATGTPKLPFLGVKPTGRSFKIESIDIHMVENGRIVRSYHVENWLKATFQLRAPKK